MMSMAEAFISWICCGSASAGASPEVLASTAGTRIRVAQWYYSTGMTSSLPSCSIEQSIALGVHGLPLCTSRIIVGSRSDASTSYRLTQARCASTGPWGASEERRTKNDDGEAVTYRQNQQRGLEGSGLRCSRAYRAQYQGLLSVWTRPGRSAVAAG